MDALKVRVSRVIACLNQRLEAGLHQSANAAAENCLLAEEVGLGLGTERGLQNACSCAADTECISKADVPSVARCILLDRDEARYALACLILASDRVTRALRRDHDDVDVLRRLDAAEVNVKAVCKCQGLALGQVRLNALFVQCSLLFIVDENHDDVRSHIRHHDDNDVRGRHAHVHVLPGYLRSQRHAAGHAKRHLFQVLPKVWK